MHEVVASNRQTESTETRSAKLEKWRRFGEHVREQRRQRDLGLRQLAGKVDMSPAYLSKVENGEFPPPAEKKIVAIAGQLGLSPDSLLALAGKVAKDIKAIINKHPEAWTEVLRKARTLGDAEIRQLGRKL